MITLEQLKEFLATFGITAPDFILECLVEKVNGMADCLDNAGISECDQTLIMIYTAALLALGQGATRLDSDKLPSGAARTYALTPISEIQDMLYNNLQVLDTAGCSSALLPKSVNGAFFAVVGGCKC